MGDFRDQARGEHKPNVALADEDACVVNRLGQAQLEDLRLQAALEEILHLRWPTTTGEPHHRVGGGGVAVRWEKQGQAP